MMGFRLVLASCFLASLAGAQSTLFQMLDNPIPGPAAVQTAGDVDADGDEDLLIADGLMVNDGHGRFAKVAVSSVAFTRQNPRLADLNGDGLADLISLIPTTGPTVSHLRIDLNAGMIDLYGTPGGAWLLGTANGTTSSSLPPFGTLLIDPASAQIMAMGTFAGPSAPLPGTASLGAIVPNNLGLIGWTTYWQAIDAAQMRLTNRIQITVLGF